MASSKQMRHLIHNPMAHMRFTTTGQLPRTVRPQGPLMDVLDKIAPRDLGLIVGLNVGPELGYKGSRRFHTAAQALRWCKPDTEMLANESWPAESWRLKGFRGPLFLDNVLAQASSYPENLLARYPRLRAPTTRALQNPASTADQDPDGTGQHTDPPDRPRG